MRPPQDPDLLGDARRLEAVRRAEAAVRSDPSALERLTRLAARLLGVEFGFVSLVHDDVEVLLAVHAPDGRPWPVALPADQAVCRLLVETGAALFLADITAHPALRGLEQARLLGLRSYAGTPVTGDGGLVLGGFCVASSSPRSWTRQDEALLADLSAAVSTELRLRVSIADLHQLETLTRRRVRQQAALHRVAEAVARGETPEEVLRRVAEELAALLEVSAALVLRFPPDGGTEVAAAAGRAVSADTGRFSSVVQQVRRTGTPAVDDNGDEPCAAVPIVLRGRTWGAILASGPEGPSRGTLSRLEKLADFIGLVISNTEAQRQLVELARTDPLTGAVNRRGFEERLAEELERSHRYGRALTLALIDVDRFKRINDEQGHDVGDGVLAALTRRVQAGLRVGDLLARLGGDEFAVVLPETEHTAAAEAVERIRASVADAELSGVAVTVTVGAAVMAGRVPSADELYRAADHALYAAKHRGGNTSVVADLP